MKHWRIEDLDWSAFDPSRVDPEIVPLVKAAAMVERNGTDYAIYLSRVFSDDPAFQQAAANWAVEEVQHGDALGRWAQLADPGWDYMACFERYRAEYKINVDVHASIRGSRTGELISRCIVETGTSSYYTALAEATDEPVLAAVCRQIAADEFRHFKLFYDHMRRYLGREDIGVAKRFRIAAGRVGETEDDELAYAYHCSNEPPGVPYDHQRCLAGYLGRAMSFYRPRHIERGVGMILKAIGLPPRGRFSRLTLFVSWRLLVWRRNRFAARIARQRAEAQPGAHAPAAA